MCYIVALAADHAAISVKLCRAAADKRSVTFHLLVAYGLAVCGIVILGLLARSNRRAGWRRERVDVMGDVLLLWTAEMANRNLQANAGPVAAASGVTSDLIAMQSIVGAAAGVQPGSFAHDTRDAADGAEKLLKR